MLQLLLQQQQMLRSTCRCVSLALPMLGYAAAKRPGRASRSLNLHIHYRSSIIANRNNIYVSRASRRGPPGRRRGGYLGDPSGAP